ncbi:YsnF/AvaK domain-containing protein [Rhodovastum atsumiense]|uniref:YsnF/AvaK domain-containing protein n=1 Tax=Rhodovastum atsumiense TaxID=504468 RepID=UPI00139F2C18|nr:DUF2382 domain-containing protein [Rhodovastum atsumiense]
MPQRYTERSTDGIQVVPVGEERLNVATRTVPGEVTRVRRRVVSQPVEQQVTLRDEKVVIERRRPSATDGRNNVLTETVIELSDSRQVPTVWKSLHVAEEVVLRKQVTERTERVRETVRRDVVDVEHENGPAEFAAKEIGSTPVTLLHGTEEHRGPAPTPAAKPGEEERRSLEEVGEKKAGPGQPPQPPRKP